VQLHELGTYPTALEAVARSLSTRYNMSQIPPDLVLARYASKVRAGPFAQTDMSGASEALVVAVQTGLWGAASKYGNVPLSCLRKTKDLIEPLVEMPPVLRIPLVPFFGERGNPFLEKIGPRTGDPFAFRSDPFAGTWLRGWLDRINGSTFVVLPSHAAISHAAIFVLAFFVFLCVVLLLSIEFMHTQGRPWLRRTCARRAAAGKELRDKQRAGGKAE
jgi:hypothetical protein